MFKTNLAAASAEWTNEIFGPTKTTIRALILADGKVNFIRIDEQFSLTFLCDLLKQSQLPWENIEITTAHRNPLNTEAMRPGFTFDKLDKDAGENVFLRDNFHQVWLFGSEPVGSRFCLSDREIEIVSDFMKRGGGVFATGDHKDLGAALCSKLPRVKSMRKWQFGPSIMGPAPDQFGPSRIDSLREGGQTGFDRRDEMDEFAQEIRPKFFVNKFRTAAQPHPLLAHSPVAISFLPDHMHEGECVIPAAPLNKDEFPAMLDTSDQVSPVVVAISTSAGGAFFPKSAVVPVEPRCYCIIAAYDGHYVEWIDNDHDQQVKQYGRVVVDSTFHHFLNYNLMGFLDPQGNPSEKFKIITKYYRNILTWLGPADLQSEYYLNLLLALRFAPPLLEEIGAMSKDNWDHVLRVGLVTLGTLRENLSMAEAMLCAVTVAKRLKKDLSRVMTKFLDPWGPNADSEALPVFFDSEIVAAAILGGVMLGIASQLPNTHYEVRKTLSELLEAEGLDLASLAAEGLKGGMAALSEEILKSNETLHRFSRDLVG